jgi:hypothetical protein
MLTGDGASPAEWDGRIKRAVEKGWLRRDESGSFYQLDQARSAPSLD